MFLPFKADLEHFKRNKLLFDEEVIDYFRDTEIFVGGFIDASKELDFELVPTVYASAGACMDANNIKVLSLLLTRDTKIKWNLSDFIGY